MADKDSPVFGQSVREKEFNLEKDWNFLNTGSYGVTPKCVQEAQQRHQFKMNSHPEKWFRREVEPLYKEATKEAADFVGCDSQDLVFVQNATTGINTVLKSYPYEKEDCILVTNATYGAIKKTCNHVGSNITDGKAIYIEFSIPIESEDQIVEKFKRAIAENPSIKIAVIDHITSPTAMILPVKKIAALCRENGILSMIDGAHAPGQLDLNIEELNVDFYTGNFHKWVFTPRGCAILYINRNHHDWVKPLVTSHNYQRGPYWEFEYQGTRDDTPYTVVPHALQFYKRMGGVSRVREYNSDLLDKGVEMLCSSFDLRRFPIPKSMEAPYMRLLILPKVPGYGTTEEDANRLFAYFAEKYNIVLLVVSVFDHLIIRLSAQIFNTMDDYNQIVDILKDLLKKDDEK
ncbi:hypothetical protein FSP39_009673 [Pinctada imbricata]|uniref:Aminotransferase class V domain-containing protein n=1 Tax=Pinctada imbricata TaxID=66713 RepID=A0AA88XKZ3_PINIB|nr:hypothetical protein FSP39_009673 [Pinctada imbricata]